MAIKDKAYNSRCWGLTEQLHLCKRTGKWRLFCPDHFRTSMLLYVSLLMNIVGVIAAVYTISQIWGPSDARLRSMVYSNVNSACHSWKNAYIFSVPGRFGQYDGEYSHVWEMLINVEPPKYSAEAWRYYLPLFEQRATYVRHELDRLLASHSDVMPYDLRVLIELTNIQIEIEQSAYQQLTRMLRATDDKDVFFQVRFQSIIRVLAKLSREADRLREEID